MINSFHQSLMVTPRRVAGIQLLPLSAWHCIYLDIDENPFWCGGRKTVVDVARMIWICTSKFGDDLMSENNITRLDVIRKSLECKKLDEYRSELAEHLIDYIRLPHITKENKVNKPPASPISFRAVVGTMSAMNIQEERAWNMPFNLLMCYWFQYLQDKGAVDIISDEIVEWARS